MASCAQLPAEPDQKSVCCVIEYNFQGEPIGSISCIPIGGGYLATDCTQIIDFPLLGGNTRPVPLGRVEDCCHDCSSPERKLVISGGRLVRNGGQFATSPENEPDKCCCNGECVCKEVPDCAQVRCSKKAQPTPTDKCKARCVIKTYDEDGYEVIDDRQVICATITQCCAEDNTKCEAKCQDARFFLDGSGSTTIIPAANEWMIMPCTDCGVCCVNNYDEDPSSPTFRQVLSKTGTKDKTQEECEALTVVFFPNPTPLSVGVWYTGTDDVNICNPPCCQDTVRGDERATLCAPTSATECDPCIGRCIEVEYENNPTKCPRATCKSKQDCCGDNGEKCEPPCNQIAQYRWDKGCGDNIKCGACCRIEYSSATAPTPNVTCLEDIENAADCKLTVADIAAQLDGRVITYRWRAFETCATAKCATKKCCGANCPGRVGCIDVDFNATCDPCKGSCLDVNAQTSTCTTKQACCGDDGAKCRGCPGTGEEGGGATAPEFEWSGCFENGQLCGVCCVITRNAAGEPVSSTCEEESYEECIARGDNASWKAFETCSSAICIPQLCCNDEICPGQTICVAIDKDRGACDDPCRGECYAIDETGVKDGDPFCATKVDCCGEQNEKCAPVAGFCPEGNTTPSHSWPNECADGELCGTCCKRNLNPDGSLASLSCDETKDNQTACQAANFGIWYPFGTCAACGNTKPACVETKCKKIVTIDGVEQEVMVPNATCKPVSPDRASCKGICTELATVTRPYATKTCKIRSACCGPDDANCISTGCGSVVTHAFDTSCIDGEQCGICCIVTNIGDGNLTPGSPQLDIGRAACEALNTATPRFGIGNTTTWTPFGGASACSGTPCPTECPDGTFQCVNKQAPEVCVEPCNGRCVGVDGSVSLKTKKDCCVVDGVNLCALTDVRCPKPVWSPVCEVNSSKCGAACKTTYNAAGTVILSSECVAGLTTQAAMALAQAGAPAGVVYTWYPWDTCETVICRSKICCGKLCEDAGGNDVIGCKVVDYNDECDKCNGLCYDAIKDPVTHVVTKVEGSVPECLPRDQCCGAANEKCAFVPGCPKDQYKVYEACDLDCPQDFDCPGCTGPDYEANNRPAEGGEEHYDGYFTSKNCYKFLVQTDISAIQRSSLRQVRPDCNARGPDTFESVYGATFKECYPALLSGKPVYLYVEAYQVWKFLSRFPVGAEGYYSERERLSFYVCQDKQLIDITDTIFDFHALELCFPGSPEYIPTNIEVYNNFTVSNVFDRAYCAKNKIIEQANGDTLAVYKVTMEECSEDEDSELCSDWFTGLPEPNMLGCPAAFTANPLP